MLNLPHLEAKPDFGLVIHSFRKLEDRNELEDVTLYSLQKIEFGIQTHALVVPKQVSTSMKRERLCDTFCFFDQIVRNFYKSFTMEGLCFLVSTALLM